MIFNALDFGSCRMNPRDFDSEICELRPVVGYPHGKTRLATPLFYGKWENGVVRVSGLPGTA